MASFKVGDPVFIKPLVGRQKIGINPKMRYISKSNNIFHIIDIRYLSEIGEYGYIMKECSLWVWSSDMLENALVFEEMKNKIVSDRYKEDFDPNVI